jgi:hypothetical protein
LPSFAKLIMVLMIIQYELAIYQLIAKVLAGRYLFL